MTQHAALPRWMSLFVLSVLVMPLPVALGEETERVRERSEIDVEYRWATENIFPDDGAWKKEFATVEAEIPELGAEGCQHIEGVAMDMNAAYEAEVTAQCPQADIVYDFFHLVAKYGREVIDKVRTSEAKRHTNREERQVIKG